MALLDILKKEKGGRSEEKRKSPKTKESVIDKKKTEEEKGTRNKKIKDVKKSKQSRKTLRKKLPEAAYKVLIAPYVTEKTTAAAEKNQYVFKVFSRANKIQIKKAIEDVFGVSVEQIRTVNIHRKPKRIGGRQGWEKGYKKAIIKVRQDQKIDILTR